MLAEQKPGNFMCSLKCCILLGQHIHRTHSDYTWLHSPSYAKWSIVCVKQDLGRVHNIQLSITNTLIIYQVCRDVDSCVKTRSCSSLMLEWKSAVRKHVAIARNCMASVDRNIWQSSISLSPPSYDCIKSSFFRSFSVEQKRSPLPDKSVVSGAYITHFLEGPHYKWGGPLTYLAPATDTHHPYHLP